MNRARTYVSKFGNAIAITMWVHANGNVPRQITIHARKDSHGREIDRKEGNMSEKIKKKETWKLPEEPEWSFRLLGIPPGHTIEFLYEGVFLKEKGETFRVEDSQKTVAHRHEGRDCGVPEDLVTFTKKLREKLKELGGPNFKGRRTIESWIYHNPQAKPGEPPIALDVLCDEKKRQYYEKRDELHSTITIERRANSMVKGTRVGEQGEYVKEVIKAAKSGILDLRNKPGLYALYKEDELVKIDAAIDLKVVLWPILSVPEGLSFCMEEVELDHPRQYEPYLRAKKQELIERYKKDHDGEAPRYNKATS